MPINTPFRQHKGKVKPEWIDYNGHMNVAFYVLAFDLATDDFFDYVGLDQPYRKASGCTTFALESHVSYLRELKLDEPYDIHTQLIDYDNKRIHFFHKMYHAEQNFLAATLEIISMHIDRAGPRSAEMPPVLQQQLAAIMNAHAELETPPQLGSVIGIRRAPSAGSVNA